MNEHEIFQSTEFGELSVLVIDGKERFPASEYAAMLGYANPRKAIFDHCRCVTKHDVPQPQNPDKHIEKNSIHEGDLCRHDGKRVRSVHLSAHR